jgi:hypothetical protein
VCTPVADCGTHPPPPRHAAVAYHRGIALGKTPIVHIAGGILPSVQYLDEVKVE